MPRWNIWKTPLFNFCPSFCSAFQFAPWCRKSEGPGTLPAGSCHFSVSPPSKSCTPRSLHWRPTNSAVRSWTRWASPNLPVAYPSWCLGISSWLFYFQIANKDSALVSFPLGKWLYVADGVRNRVGHAQKIALERVGWPSKLLNRGSHPSFIGFMLVQGEVGVVDWSDWIFVAGVKGIWKFAKLLGSILKQWFSMMASLIHFTWKCFLLGFFLQPSRASSWWRP